MTRGGSDFSYARILLPCPCVGHTLQFQNRDRIEVEIRLSHRQKEEGTQFIYISMITNYPAFGFFMLP